MTKSQFTSQSLENADLSASPRGAQSEHGEPMGRRPLSETHQTARKGGGDNFLALRYGVDSLYISYQGEMLNDARTELANLKEMAQDVDREHLAQAKIGEHIFTVSDKGRGHYRYLLIDGCFEIQLCEVPNPAIPVAYVKVRSRMLATMSPTEVEAHLRKILRRLCNLSDKPGTVSRADLFLDFCCDDAVIRNLSPSQFICRAEIIRPYFTNYQLTAFDVGLGGDLSARLYDKTLQLAVSKQTYLLDLWKAGGWNGKRTVWRIEFQLRRSILGQMYITSVPQLDQQRGAIWTYLTKEWLRLVIPNPKDKTRSRWETHPLWDAIWDGACGALDQPMLRKIYSNQAPDTSAVLMRLCGSLSTIFACEGISDIRQGAKWLGANLEDLLHHGQTAKMEPLDSYLREQIRKKVRLLNLAKNDNDLFSDGNF